MPEQLSTIYGNILPIVKRTLLSIAAALIITNLMSFSTARAGRFPAAPNTPSPIGGTPGDRQSIDIPTSAIEIITLSPAPTLELTGTFTTAIPTNIETLPVTITETRTPIPTMTPSPIMTEAPIPSETETPTPTMTGISTITNTGTLTSTPTLDQPIFAATIVTPTISIFLPSISWQPPPVYTPPVKVLFCDSLPASRYIPDNDVVGIDDTLTIADSRQILDIDVLLNISHTRVGDLNVEIFHEDVDQSVKLLNRPGREGSGYGCTNADVRTILDDEISSPAENKCAATPAAISGIYIPNQPLSWLDGGSMAGRWRLNVSDRAPSDTGSLNGWCLLATVSENPAPPTPPPPPPQPPSSAMIQGVSGEVQSLPLDCESRSAVDWANYFGVFIDELDFYHLLPHSDNPDKGFVGSVYGTWGQIPPNAYGVHAEPVAELLRDHGLGAYAHRPLSWVELRAEIAAGRPVIVWIIDSVGNGIPVYYTPSDGLHTVVARYEHTVIVTGYNSNSVYYLNGNAIYTRSVTQFLDSWSALGNMAITTQP